MRAVLLLHGVGVGINGYEVINLLNRLNSIIVVVRNSRCILGYSSLKISCKLFILHI
jgi:hypothetical protein